MKVRFAVAPGGEPPDAGALIAFGETLEARGFDGVWLSDLPLGPTLDPLLGLALIAGRTRKLRLGANVVPLGRNPFLLAKQLAQLDQLSGGRVLLSFVPGIDEPGERAALGVNGATRGAVLEESLALIRAWWSGETVEHESERWTFTGLAPAALPVQDPLEVWLGGRGPQALERIGRVADGWLGAAMTPEEARAGREAIQASAAAAGREIDPEHFGLSIIYAREEPQPEHLAAIRRRRRGLDPLRTLPIGRDALQALIAGYVEAGLSKFVVRPLAPVSSWEDEAGWLGETILPLQT